MTEVSFIGVKKLFSKIRSLFNNAIPYVVSEMEVQDIDNETDWELAEVKYQYMRGN